MRIGSAPDGVGHEAVVPHLTKTFHRLIPNIPLFSQHNAINTESVANLNGHRQYKAPIIIRSAIIICSLGLILMTGQFKTIMPGSSIAYCVNLIFKCNIAFSSSCFGCNASS